MQAVLPRVGGDVWCLLTRRSSNPSASAEQQAWMAYKAQLPAPWESCRSGSRARFVSPRSLVEGSSPPAAGTSPRHPPFLNLGNVCREKYLFLETAAMKLFVTREGKVQSYELLEGRTGFSFGFSPRRREQRTLWNKVELEGQPPR